jgi:hypothetical protein
MPVYAILKQEVDTRNIIQEQFNLSDFSIFKRGTIKDFIRGMVKEISTRLPKDTQLREIREKLNDKEKLKIILQMRVSNRVFVITDIEYNSEIAYGLLDKCFDNSNYEDLIKEYRQWEDKDQFKKIEDELEKCNVIVMEGLSQVLQRGESLND